MSQLDAVLQEHGIPCSFIDGAKDIWCRDYMPVQAGEDQFVQFTYAPDYLEDYPELVTHADQWAIADELKAGAVWDTSDLVIDGGNVVAGEGGHVVLTDKVYQENPPHDQPQLQESLREQLRDVLRARTVIIIPVDRDDWIGHADGVLWFAGPRRVLVNDYGSISRSYRRRLLRTLADAGLDYVEMPYAPPENDDLSAEGNYVNILRVGKLVAVPAYGWPEDRIACDLVRAAVGSECHVRGIDCSAIAAEGGCVNCIAWSIRVPEARLHILNGM